MSTHDLVHRCRNDEYIACEQLDRNIDTDRNLTRSATTVRSPTGCTAIAHQDLFSDPDPAFHGPCSPAEKERIKDRLNDRPTEPTLRSAAAQTKDLLDTVDTAKTAAGIAGITIGTATGEPTITGKSAELVF